MFFKVRDFFTQHAASFPADSVGGQLFAALLLIISQIEQLSAQTLSAIGEVGQSIDVKGDAKDLLRDLLQDIVQMARTMAFEINGLENKFRMPRNQGVPSLIAAGRAFAADALEYKADFIRYGLSADFITQLTAAADALEQAYSETGEDTQERIGKIASVVPLFEDGMIKVNRLNPIVKMKFRNDAAALAAWTFAKHVERAPQSPKPANQPNP